MMDEVIRRAVEAALTQMLPQFVDAVSAEVKRRIDAECAGTSTYHPKRKRIDEEIGQRFNGRNASELARDLGISRATVYNAIARRRKTMGR